MALIIITVYKSVLVPIIVAIIFYVGAQAKIFISSAASFFYINGACFFNPAIILSNCCGQSWHRGLVDNL